MLSFIAPHSYIRGSGVLKSFTEYSQKLGRRYLIIAGNTAWSKVSDVLISQIELCTDAYHVELVEGPPTHQKVNTFAALVQQEQLDVVVGIGGGRILDLTKAVAHQAGVFAITVPTVPATCAAWAALSVIYSDEGRYKEVRMLPRSPEYIIADTDILLAAPKRYLYAGVADSLAKWFETSANTDSSISLRLQLSVAKFAAETMQSALVDKNKSDQSSLDLIDGAILLAGLVGSFRGERFYNGFAHPLYNSMTQFSVFHQNLHGEMVGFGLLVQMILQKKSSEHIDGLIKVLQLLKQPLTFQDLGVKDNLQAVVNAIAEDVIQRLKNTAFYEQLSINQVIDALLQANELGQNLIRKETGDVYVL